MFVAKKAVPRRTVLRGIGATLALPFLDSMVPALSALARTAAKPVNRFGVMYVPNGMIMQNYLPAVEGAAYELTPTLAALAPFREQVLVLSGLECIPTPGRPGGWSTAVTRSGWRCTRRCGRCLTCSRSSVGTVATTSGRCARGTR